MDKNTVEMVDEEGYYVLKVVDNSVSYGPISRNTFFRYNCQDKSEVYKKALEFLEKTRDCLDAVVLEPV